MAIDTAAKRLAALHFGSVQPSLALPVPDGTVDDDDKYVLIGLYPFEAGAGEETTAWLGSTIRRRRRLLPKR